MMSTRSNAIASLKLLESQTDQLLKYLLSCFPHSIPLTRRIQYQLRHPSPTAQVFLAVKGSDTDSSDQSNEDCIDRWLTAPSLGHWLAAYIDLANPGQTQCWLFGSWELPCASRDADVERGMISMLCRHIFTTLVPLQPLNPSAEWLLLRDTGKYLSQPYNRNKVLFGTVHDKVRKYIPEHSITRVDASYGKYIFSQVRPAPQQSVKLPEGYAFGPMTGNLLQGVLDRTPIPRTLKMLRELLSVGLYYTSQPGREEVVGWGFLSKDGSLASLHTEPDHRGKGLAVAVGKELMRRQCEMFGEEGLEYVHADVSESNAASSSVMRKLGGKVLWRVAWAEVDLGVVMGEQEKGKEKQ